MGWLHSHVYRYLDGVGTQTLYTGVLCVGGGGGVDNPVYGFMLLGWVHSPVYRYLDG